MKNNYILKPGNFEERLPVESFWTKFFELKGIKKFSDGFEYAVIQEKSLDAKNEVQTLFLPFEYITDILIHINNLQCPNIAECNHPNSRHVALLDRNRPVVYSFFAHLKDCFRDYTQTGKYTLSEDIYERHFTLAQDNADKKAGESKPSSGHDTFNFLTAGNMARELTPARIIFNEISCKGLVKFQGITYAVLVIAPRHANTEAIELFASQDTLGTVEDYISSLTLPKKTAGFLVMQLNEKKLSAAAAFQAIRENLGWPKFAENSATNTSVTTSDFTPAAE